MRAKVKAYAKINLLLDVLYKRDDGYHEVEMVMQTIGLCDDLTLEAAAENRLYVNSSDIPHDERNLALKAALVMQREFPQLPPVAITLEKHIPAAAGMAGGSSDGAAVLLGLNRLFDLHCSPEKLQMLAAELGSDVPFCLSGPTALARGRGEVIIPQPAAPKLYLTLIKPPFGVSTPEVYRNLNVAAIHRHPDCSDYLQALAQGDGEGLLAKMCNVLEESTFALYPPVAHLQEEMRALGGRHVLMSGSGPTVFCGFTDKAEAETFYHKLRARYPQAILTETLTERELESRVIIDES